MRDSAARRLRPGNRPCANLRAPPHEVAGTISHAIFASRARCGPLTTGTGTARSIGGYHAPPFACKLRSVHSRVADAHAVDIETHQFIETGTESATTPGDNRSGAPATDSGFISSAGGEITLQNWVPGQAQLQLKVQELASANRRKDEFLAVLSHELRSPLSAIHFAVSVLRRQCGASEPQQRMQALIERQLGRMRQLVDELLDVSRITNGRMDLQRERMDLRVIMNNAIETLESDLIERHQRLTIELPEAPVWLQADRGRLEQVFLNLVGNASRYTDACGELTVRMHAENGQAVVRIRDSGIGIAPHALAHIFELFKQTNESDPRSKAGLGVGLAVVRKLVELHEGSVTAASAGRGRGSEFTVRLRTLPP